MGGSVETFIITMAVLVLGITLHEFSHAYAADRLGDPTPRRQGRISVLPPDHLDPVGTLMMAFTAWFGFGLGWGKPVMVNTANFRNPRRDHGLVAVAGPASNIVQAIVYASIFRLIGPSDSSVALLLTYGVLVNLSLAFFNLIPLNPLDGSWIVTALLPAAQARTYEVWMLKYGPLAFLLLIFVFRDVLSAIIGPPVFTVARILVPWL